MRNLLIALFAIVLIVFLSFLTIMRDDAQPAREITTANVSVTEGTVLLENGVEKRELNANEAVTANSGGEIEGISTPLATMTQETAGPLSGSQAGSATDEESRSSSHDIATVTSETFYIAGYVLDIAGNKLSGAKVSAYPHQDNPSSQTYLTTSDENGYYALVLNGTGEFNVRSTPPGDYLEESAALVFSSTETALRKDFLHEIDELVLRGVVLSDRTNEPVSGADVLLCEPGGWGDPVIKAQTVSNEDGSFAIREIAEGMYGLVVRAEGYVPQEMKQKYDQQNPLDSFLVDRQTVRNPLTIKMQPGYAALFRVFDPQQNPVSGAKIKIGMRGDYRKVEGTTDGKGEWKVTSLLASTSAAAVEKEPYGYVMTEPFEPGTIDNPAVVEVTLTNPASISGRVTFKKGLLEYFDEIEPAADYRVVAYSKLSKMRLDGMSNGMITRMVTTDENGYYRFEELGEGPHGVYVAPKYYNKGNLPFETKEVTLSAGEERTDFDFEIPREEKPEEEIRGNVVDDYNQPIAGVEILLNVYEQELQFSDCIDIKTVHTDENGGFHFTEVHKGKTFSLFLNKKGYHQKSEDFTSYDEVRTIVMKPAGAISGTVISKETRLPIPSANVLLRNELPFSNEPNQPFTTSTDGAFYFKDISGTYFIDAEAEGYSQTTSQPFTVRAGENVANVVLELEPGAFAGGVVTDERNQPVPDAEIVMLSRVQGDIFKNRFYEYHDISMPVAQRTDAAGRFRLHSILPNGDTLLFRHRNFAPTQVAITAEHFGRDDIHVVLPTGGQLRGRVTDANGSPVSNVRMFAFDFPTNLLSFGGVTDGNGEYLIERLPAMELTVKCTVVGTGRTDQDEHQYRKTRIENGKTSRLDFQLGSDYVIRGTGYKNGTPLPNALAGLLLAQGFPAEYIPLKFTKTGEDGAYELTGFAEGNYILMFVEDGFDPRTASQETRKQMSTPITITPEQTVYEMNLHVPVK